MFKKLARWYKRKTMPYLAPCPFCGGDSYYDDQDQLKIIHDMVASEWFVYCNSCEARGSFAWNKKLAIRQWNKRRD